MTTTRRAAALVTLAVILGMAALAGDAPTLTVERFEDGSAIVCTTTACQPIRN